MGTRSCTLDTKISQRKTKNDFILEQNDKVYKFVNINSMVNDSHIIAVIKRTSMHSVKVKRL